MEEPVWKEEFFESKDGTRLFCGSLVPDAPKAAVAVMHGYGDHSGRYRHVLEALAAKGFAAYGFDFRGEGRAGGRRGYISAFSDYLADVSAILAKLKEKAAGKQTFLFAHSTGGLAAAALLEEDPTAGGLSGVVLSAPYLRLRIEPSKFQLFQANVVGKVIPFLPIKNPMKTTQLTHDPEMMKAADADPLRHHVVTPKWFTESTAGQERTRANAAKFTLPLLVMVGGEDPVAHPDAGKEFEASAGSTDKKLIVWPGMFHEIVHETERAKVIGELIGWIEARVKA